MNTRRGAPNETATSNNDSHCGRVGHAVRFRPPPESEAQTRVPPVTNVSVRNGVNPGEAIISWDVVPFVTHYRIGYVNMEADYPLAKASRTGDWINAFIYVDEDARNLRVADGRAEYTVRRLAQGVRHAFTVLSSGSVVNNRHDLIGSYSWPQNPRWRFLTVTDQGGSCPTIAPVIGDHTGQGSICPITGLPIPAGGYLGVGDTASFGNYSFTLNSVQTPQTLTLSRSDGTTYEEDPPPGRRWLRLRFRHVNDRDYRVNLQRGRDYILSTDAGAAFSWSGDRVVEPDSFRDTFVSFDVPADATAAVLAVREGHSNAADADNAPGLFRIDVPAPASARRTITFGDLNWHSALVQTRIAQYVVEKGYGYPTDVKFGATLPLFQGLRRGDVDVLMEL